MSYERQLEELNRKILEGDEHSIRDAAVLLERLGVIQDCGERLILRPEEFRVLFTYKKKSLGSWVIRAEDIHKAQVSYRPLWGNAVEITEIRGIPIFRMYIPVGVRVHTHIRGPVIVDYSNPNLPCLRMGKPMTKNRTHWSIRNFQSNALEHQNSPHEPLTSTTALGAWLRVEKVRPDFLEERERLMRG